MSLREPLPLRTTADWGDYREAQVIPIRYGETGGALLQYGADRRRWVWAGHAIGSIDEVLVGDVPVSNWIWSNTKDNAGKPIAMVTFDQPQDEGVSLIARGRGKVSPIDGAVMVNPAVVVRDLLTLAGRSTDAAELATFRRECAALGLSVGGSIEGAVAPIALDTVRELCESVGAAFAPDAAGLCFLRTSTPAGTVRGTVDARAVLVSCRAALGDLVNEITVRHGFEAGQPRGQVKVSAPDSIRRHGLRVLTLDARWLAYSARQAAELGQRLLRRLARPAYQLSAGGLKRSLAIGDVVHVELPDLPIGPTQVLGIERDFVGGSSQVSVELPVGSVPRTQIEQLSEQAAALVYESAELDTQGDLRIITVRDATGKADAGAVVQINGGASMRTDGAGRVSIAAELMPPGNHLLLVTLSDLRQFTMQVRV